MNIDLKKTPKVFFVVVGLLVVFFVCLFVFFIPTINDIPTYNADHDDIEASVAYYQDVLDNKKTFEQRIENMQKEYENNQSIYVDVNSSVKDLQDVFAGTGIKLIELQRSEGFQDTQNRISKAGYPLYYTNLSFSYNGTENTAKKIMRYMEKESNGCYFINQLTMTPIEGSSTEYLTNFVVTLYYFNASATPTTVAEATT